jgi:hypothetical protein
MIVVFLHRAGNMALFLPRNRIPRGNPGLLQSSGNCYECETFPKILHNSCPSDLLKFSSSEVRQLPLWAVKPIGGLANRNGGKCLYGPCCSGSVPTRFRRVSCRHAIRRHTPHTEPKALTINVRQFHDYMRCCEHTYSQHDYPIIRPGSFARQDDFILQLLSHQAVNEAFVLYPGGSFGYEKRDIPTLQAERDVLVRVVATGLCGSDVSCCLRDSQLG